MPLSLRTSARTAMAQGIITDAGANAKMKFYDGTRPAGLAAVGGGNNLRATLTFGANIGVATSGGIDFDEAGITQNSANHTNGTPTFVDITTSADVVVARLDLGAGGFTFTGSIVANQNVVASNLSWTMPHA